MTDLLRYRQPVPVTLALALMVAALVWTVATLVTGTDALWFRMVYCAAVVAIAPAALESPSVALALDPDNCWFRFVYGINSGFLVVLLAAVAGFPYIQTAPASIRLAVLLVAIGFGVMTAIRSPHPPDYIVQDYDRNTLHTGGFSMFFTPLLIVLVTYILFSTDFVSAKHLSDRSGQSILVLSALALFSGGRFSIKLVAGVSIPNNSTRLLALAALFFAVFFLLHR